MSRAEDRDLGHEADMRALRKAQLEADFGDELERNAEGTYDYDDLSDEEWDDVELAERNRDWF